MPTLCGKSHDDGEYVNISYLTPTLVIPPYAIQSFMIMNGFFSCTHVFYVKSN